MPEYTTGRATPIENRNFLAPTGFKFTLERAKSVSFFCNQANVPDITLGIAEQPSWLKNIDVPSEVSYIDEPGWSGWNTLVVNVGGEEYKATKQMKDKNAIIAFIEDIVRKETNKWNESEGGRLTPNPNAAP